MLDLTTEFGERVSRRLGEEEIIWLTTVGADGTPQPSPVWFLWDGETILIYSRDNAPKIKNIARNPRVALSLNTDPLGEDVVILIGDARVDQDAPSALALPEYLLKYRDGIERIGMTPENFAAAYSVALRVTPTKLRGY